MNATLAQRILVIACLVWFWLQGTHAQEPIIRIQPILPVTTLEDTPIRHLPIRIHPDDTDTSRLRLLGRSSNQLLFTDSSLVFGGNGVSRTLQLSPEPNASGVATITVILQRGTNEVARQIFQVGVTAVPDTVDLSAIKDVNAIVGEQIPPVSLSFTSIEATAVNYQVESSNTGLVDTEGLRVVKRLNSTNSVLLIRPKRDMAGSSTIRVSARRADNAAEPSFQSFVLTVRPAMFAVGRVGRATDGMPVTGDFGGTNGWMTWIAGSGMLERTIIHPGTNESGPGVLNLSSQAVFADFNGDGRLDFLTYRSDNTTSFQIWTNHTMSAASEFTYHQAIAYRSVPGTRVVAGDWDRDGDIDLWVSDKGISLLENRGVEGGFAVKNTGINRSLGSFDTGDFDGDGHDDVVAFPVSGISGNNSVLGSIWRNTGDGRLEEMPEGALDVDAFGARPYPAFIAGGTADLDGDGWLDVWMHSSIGSTKKSFIAVFLNQAGRGWVLAHRIPVRDGMTTDLRKAQPIHRYPDIDGDGLPDLMMKTFFLLAVQGEAAQTVGQIDFIRNMSGGYFAAGSFGFADATATGIIGFADVNRDGTPDPVVNLSRTGTAQYLVNQTQHLNALPGEPRNLQGSFDGRQIRLNWAAAKDPNQTTPLSYEVRVGSTPGASDILSARSFPDGHRQVMAPGNAGFLTHMELTPSKEKLAGVTALFWSVQAVDASWAGGAFAPESQIVTDPDADRGQPPTILPIGNITMDATTQVRIPVTVGDDRTPIRLLNVQAFVNRPDWLRISTVTREVATQQRWISAIRQSVAPEFGEVTVTVIATDGDGLSASREMRVRWDNRVNPLRLDRDPTGSIRLLRLGESEDSIVVESSEDLHVWQPVETQTPFEMIPLTSSNRTRMFFRIRPNQ